MFYNFITTNWLITKKTVASSASRNVFGASPSPKDSGTSLYSVWLETIAVLSQSLSTPSAGRYSLSVF